MNQSVRTVQRWERDEGLPIHRVAGKTRGTIFAFQDELDGWLCRSDQGDAPESKPFRLWATAAATVVILAGLAAFIRFNEEVPALSTAQHIASAYARFGAISPNGGRLAYVDHRDDVLYVSELSHAADRRRISRRVVGFGVAWSSDGSRLAYVR